MIPRVTAIEFNGIVSSGRTKPIRATCEMVNGDTVEAVVKFSAGCDRREGGLAMEVLCACLAGDLGLPVPQPLLVHWDAEWAGLIPDRERREIILRSSRIAYGSKHLGPGYSAWSPEKKIPDILLPTALAVFAFDAFVQNADRQENNPNCQTKGDELRIIDHEACFPDTGGLVGWRPPWVLGGLNVMETPGFHALRGKLRGRNFDFDRIHDAWSGLSDECITDYGRWLPAEWGAAKLAVDAAMSFIKDIRDNIDGCIVELRRVLT